MKSFNEFRQSQLTESKDDWEPEKETKAPEAPDDAQLKANAKKNKEALEKISAAFAKKKVDEEVELEEEQLDELSKTTLGKYVKKAAFRVGIHGMNAGEAKAGSKEAKVANDKMGKRYSGILKATERLAKEEVELEEGKVPDERSRPELSADDKSKLGKVAELLAKEKAKKESQKQVKEETDMSQMDKYLAAISGNADFRSALDEKKLTPAELKKREEIAQAMERENPGMDMGKKMAIATAQAKKVAEEVVEEEQIDEISKETLKSYIPKAMGSKSAADFTRGVKMAQGSGGEDELRAKSEKRSAGIHKAISKLAKEELVGKQHKIDVDKDGKIEGEDLAKLRKMKNEEVELEEAVDLASLRKQIDKHTELAVKANKAGDDTAVKKHQEHVNKIKTKMAKLVRNEEVVVEGSGPLSSSDYMKGATRHDLAKGGSYEGKEIKSFHPNKEKEAREFAKKHGYVVKKKMLPSGSSITHTWDIHKEEVELQESSDAHKVMVTVSDPNHQAVSQRKEQIMKHVIVRAGDKGEAQAKAESFYKKKGYKVHGSEYHSKQPATSMKTEETQLDELDKSTLASYAKKSAGQLPGHQTNATLKHTGPIAQAHAGKHPKTGETPVQWDDRKVRNRQQGIIRAVGKLAKEETQLDELDKSTLSSYEKKASVDYASKKLKGDDEGAEKRRAGVKLARQKANEEVELDESMTLAQKAYRLGKFHKKTGFTGPNPHKNSSPDVLAAYKKGLSEETDLEEANKGYAPGWMLKADSELAKKVKEKTQGYKDLKKYAGKELPKQGVKEEVDQINERLEGGFHKSGEAADETSLNKRYGSPKPPRQGGGMSKSETVGHDGKVYHWQDPRSNKDFKITKEETELNLEDYSLEELQDFMVSEDFEQLDEISKKTLGNYIKKASQSLATASGDARDAAIHDITPSHERTQGRKAHFAKSVRNMFNRTRGIEKATNRLTKEGTEEMKTYAQFVAELVEARKTDDDWGTSDIKPLSNVRKVAGTRYGGSAQTDEPEDNDDEAKPAEKRGRGRPAGTKSGARH